MKKKAVTGIMLALLFLGMLTLAFNVQQAGARMHAYTENMPRSPFICGTTQDLPLKTIPESFYQSTVDIIHPQPGQFANYSHSFVYPNGTSWSGWWNVSYNEYVQPHIINTTHVIVRPLLPNGTFWCTVDKTNRWVTDTNPDFWWNQTWYILWIETNVTVGSTINWGTTNRTIVGSQILNAAGRYIDCWVTNASYYEDEYALSYYDKISGLEVAYQGFYGEVYFELNLSGTNIPIDAHAVGGLWVPVNKPELLAPYIGLASTILVATAATAIYVKHRKKKQ